VGHISEDHPRRLLHRGGRRVTGRTRTVAPTHSAPLVWLPGITTLKPGSATKPFIGVDAAVLDNDGKEVTPGGGGYLVLRSPWPAMLRGIYGDPERYKETYWSRYIDQYLVDHPSVAEATVCGRSDPQTGQAIVAYVTLKGGAEGTPERLAELRDHVAQRIGKLAMPASIVFTPELPKTRSGKIMRRLLRDVAEHRALGDTTTLADPAVVDEIRNRATTEAAANE
jgi:acetyl-CoA synthetase